MKIVRLAAAYFRHNLMSAMEYRSAFVLQAAGMLLNDVMLLFFWWVVFTRLPSLQGWNLSGVLTLYAVVAFGVGLATVVCGNANRLANIIVTGNLDYYLALPADPLLHLLISRMSLPAWGDLVFGLAIYLLITPDSLLKLPLFLFLGTLGAIIFVSFAVLVGSLAFFLGNAEELQRQGWMAMITFGLYPVDIFPMTVRVVLYTLIPAAFISAVPAQILTDFQWPPFIVLVLFTIGFAALAGLVFRLGLRRYESGNLVTVRG
ncbi:MAG: ABC-2 family transporter protein [Chloroflexi bacterium]|nr:ABC-2 family transporter protein [Chloroflexota bacterium]MBU1879501.1 ABC-2 family transporter protein [Chloroflexota bacterium]